MRYFLIVSGGFLLSLISLTLFGSLSYYALGSVYALCLYLLFFSKHSDGFSALFGVTLGLELFGTSRFGITTTLALLIVIFYSFLGERLRFTSRFFRYIVALLMTFLCFNLLVFSPSGFISRLVPFFILSLFAILVSYLFSYRNHSWDELI